MPSLNTQVWSARVKNGTRQAFDEVGQQCGRTAVQVLDIVGESFADGKAWIEDGKLVCENSEIQCSCGATPIFDPPELYDDEPELYHELHFDKLVKAMRDKCYPERVIRDTIDGFIDKVRDGYKYNAKRDSGEYGC